MSNPSNDCILQFDLGLTQLIQQVGDDAQDVLHGALGLAGIVLCLFSVI